jgi:hypothetical protein
VIGDSLSKPPPSATRPPHRAFARIRDKDTYTESLDCEAVRGPPVRAVACDGKRNHTSALYRRHASFGAPPSGHIPGHTRRVFRAVCSENGTKTTQGDGFLDRRLGCSRNQSPFARKVLYIVARQWTRGSQPIPPVDDVVTALPASCVGRARGSAARYEPGDPLGVPRC